MRSDEKRTFYYQAAANSLGGSIAMPFQEIIPSQASVSLPSVGGFATTRTEAFNFKEIISCRAAYTRVSGRQIAKDGPWSITATAVVEGLKILDVFTAERIVAQVSVEYPRDDSYLRVSLAGSTFEGLRLGGCDATPTLNSKLLCGARTPITYPVFLQTGREQADKMISSIKADQSRDDFQWLIDRFGRMASDRELEEDGCVLCSFVDGINRPIPGSSFGHAVEIPDFGSIFLGETLVCRSSVQVFSFRVELGCGTSGCAAGPTSQVEGHPYP
jgi:hypothetical protein